MSKLQVQDKGKKQGYDTKHIDFRDTNDTYYRGFYS